MGSKIKKLLIVFFLLVFTSSIPAFSNPKSPVIRVGISNQSFQKLTYNSIELFGTSTVFVYKNGRELIGSFPANEPIKITLSNDNYTIGDIKNLQGFFIFDCPDGQIGVANLKRKGKQALYHGAFEVVTYSKNPNQFCLVNIIEVEEYLKGVVPNEMPVSFGLEALKAQAIAARNYIQSPRTKAYAEFDAVDSVASQVYFGANTEDPLATRAVKETEGLVALYNWDLILAQYSSTAGGYTESFSNAFSDPKNKVFPSKDKPYLVAKPDMLTQTPLNTEEAARTFYMSKPNAYDILSPYYRWTREWTREELEKELATTLKAQVATGFVKPTYENGKELGEIKDIIVKRRGESGKIIELEIIGENQAFTVCKELVVRRLFTNKGKALPSANLVFDIEKDENNNILNIKAYGGGYGHGVGMSQFGAGFMATKLNMTFDKILKHYYTGISITTKPFTLETVPKNSTTANLTANSTFYSINKKATLIIDNKNDIDTLYVIINGQKYALGLSKGLNQLYLYDYLKVGENEVSFYIAPHSGKNQVIKGYIEVIQKDKDNENEYSF